jgi:hypothetical protein
MPNLSNVPLNCNLSNARFPSLIFAMSPFIELQTPALTSAAHQSFMIQVSFEDCILDYVSLQDFR